MLKVLIILYAVMAVDVFIIMLIFLCNAWKTESEIERYWGMEYPEDAGNSLLAICIFFIISIVAAVFWPGLLIILLIAWIFDRFKGWYTKLCKTKSGKGSD